MKDNSSISTRLSVEMAGTDKLTTSQRLTEHFLTCPVCFDVFTDPCTLACDHTFCRKCVIGYTKTRPDAVRRRCLPCPFCKRMTKIPDPFTPLEDWARQMKPSLLLKGLIDSFGPDSSCCNLCREGGETIQATAWCIVCEVSLCGACCKTHSRIPATRRHEVCDLSGELKVKRTPRRFMCQEHKEENIKFYCRDCKVTLCQSCCIIYHRKCESVNTLEAMLPEVRVTLERKKHRLRKQILNEEALLTKRQSQQAEIQRTKSSIQSKIRTVTQRTLDSIKEKARHLLDELDEVVGQQMSQLQTNIRAGDMAIQIYRQQTEVIDQAVSSGSEVDMYEIFHSCEAWTLESASDTKDLGIGTRIELVVDREMIKSTLAELTLGKIQVSHERFLDTESIPVLSTTVDCKTEEDKEKPSISDVTCFNLDGTDVLVVSDYTNSCLKTFYTRRHKLCTSRLELQFKPWRITKIDDYKVAVTMPDSRQISIVTVSPELSLTSTMTTSKLYLGITGLGSSKLAAGSDSPPTVDIIDLAGNVLQSFSPLYNGLKVIKYPYFLSTTKKGSILVSDNGTKSVLSLNSQGEVGFRYTPSGDRGMWSTRGIVSTESGDILVVDHMGHKVVQLTESGRYVRELLSACDGLSYPWCLHYDERGRLYVRHGSGRIKVFTFR